MRGKKFLLASRANEASTLATGLGGKGRNTLLHLLAFAFRTCDLHFAVFSDAQYQGKLLLAGFTEILVSWHFPHSFLLQGIIRFFYSNQAADIVK